MGFNMHLINFHPVTKKTLKVFSDTKNIKSPEIIFIVNFKAVLKSRSIFERAAVKIVNMST